MQRNRLSGHLALGAVFVAIVISLFMFVRGESSLESHYVIYSVVQNQRTTIEKIVEDFEDYDVVFFGEEHNDSIAHFLEYLLLEELYDRFGKKLALSMEMFDRDVQGILNEYLSNHIDERFFAKDARAWPNYSDYRPLVEFAKEKKLDVIAANAPFRYAAMANAKGQKSLESLSTTARSFIAPLPYDTAASAYYEKIVSVRHPPPIPESKTDTTTGGTSKEPKIMPANMPTKNINQGQSLWDATMAYSLHQYLKMHRGKKIMHVNGRFHSDGYFGVVQQLKRYDNKIRYLVISAFPSDSFQNIDVNQYKTLADYLIVTDPSISAAF